MKLETELNQLKQTIAHLQNKIGAENLTTNEMADLQEELMDDEDYFEWLPDVPMPIGSIKVEHEANSGNASLMENDEFYQAEDFGVSPRLPMQLNESTASTTIDASAIPSTTNDDSIASTSSITSPSSNFQQNTSAFTQMNSSSSSNGMQNDIVAGSIEFTINVSIFCVQFSFRFIYQNE